ncbi:MAG: HlyD family type I secretion periplasmic adaptor subunit [bacterium]|nr:HlyD family type I secretion periplasmic adaptor subunit [bacterium]
MTSKHDKQYLESEYMPPVVAASYRRAQRMAPILLGTVITALLTFLIWAYFAELDEVTRGEGKIIPSSQIQVINHLEGGILRGILVREGQVVKAGDILLNVDNTVAEAKLTEGKDHFYRNLADVVRLQAQIDGTDFVVPEIVQTEAPEIAKQAVSTYESRELRLSNDVKIAQQDVEQKKQEVTEQESKLTQAKEQLALVKEEIDLTAPLVKKGIAARIDLLRLKKEASQLKGDIATAQSGIVRSEAAFQQAKSKLEQVNVNVRDREFKELSDAKARFAEAQGMFTTESYRAQRTGIRSPVRGTIKRILVHTKGSVIQPGEDLVEVVPLEDNLIVEANIRPADIAFLKPGDKATIKISAYDFTIFGGLDAHLIEINPDTEVDEQGQSFYQVRLKTSKNDLEKGGKTYPIIPGMVATVDILTGKKTVLNYLLKPILRARGNALRER